MSELSELISPLVTVEPKKRDKWVKWSPLCALWITLFHFMASDTIFSWGRKWWVGVSAKVHYYSLWPLKNTGKDWSLNNIKININIIIPSPLLMTLGSGQCRQSQSEENTEPSSRQILTSLTITRQTFSFPTIIYYLCFTSIFFWRQHDVCTQLSPPSLN